MALSKTKANNATRGQKAKVEHEKRVKEALSDKQLLQAQYGKLKDDEVVKDILDKADKFRLYHIKIAQDGVGARETGHKLVDGSKEIENYFLSNAEVAAEMKKAAGIQELIDYINRMLNPSTPLAKPNKK